MQRTLPKPLIHISAISCNIDTVNQLSNMPSIPKLKIKSEMVGNQIDSVSGLNTKFQQQGAVHSVCSGANKLNGSYVSKKFHHVSLLTHSSTSICHCQKTCCYIPGLMYRFLMAHSSRRDANFLNGAPEFLNIRIQD